MKKVTSWKELTLREKIGQTVVSLCETEKHIEMCGSIQGFAERYPIGGLFNNVGMVKGLLTGENKDFKNILNEYNQYLRVPLFGTADHGFYSKEIGVELPNQMALGATNSEELAYRAGEFKAEDYKKSGVHWGFWPVCDLNISKESPITNIRAVSDNPDLTYKIVKAEIEAMKTCGVISTLKHYPGTPYNEAVDPHLAAVDNETPMDLWRSTYGKLYKALIEVGAPTIMTAHNNLVDYQTEKSDGIYPPATRSYELTTKLLREELGFRGVTITDALVMGGFGGSQAVEYAVESFLSGNDVLLWPVYEYIDEMEKRILSGEIDEAILDRAVERIWNLKKEYGIIAEKEVCSDKSVAFFEERAQGISDKCLTLVSNETKVLPLDKDKNYNICIIGVTPDDRQYEELCGLKTAFEAYGCSVSMQRNISPDEGETLSDRYDLILFALSRTPHCPMGPLDFWGEEAASVWASNGVDVSKTVVVSFGSPYFYKYYKNSKRTYINAYSHSRTTISALVRAMFGDLPFEGVSGVELC